MFYYSYSRFDGKRIDGVWTGKTKAEKQSLRVALARSRKVWILISAQVLCRQLSQKHD